MGAAALAAGVGVLWDRRWSLYLTYAVAGFFIAGWVYAVVGAIRAGAWTGYGPLEAAISVAPGAALIVVALLCAWVIRGYFSRRAAS
jgi:hypothetical protein